MQRVRLAGAILAFLTLLMTILFWFHPDMDATAIACTAVGAICLLLVVPFKASNPGARKRVVAACFAYVIATVAAIFFALQSPVGLAPVGMLAMLAACGLVLTIWAFATRNRWLRPQWKDYYDR